MQTSKWPTREKNFHARRFVSYLLINNPCNVVAIDRFLVSQANMLLLNGHNNAAYMGTEIFQVADTCMLASLCGVLSRAYSFSTLHSHLHVRIIRVKKKKKTGLHAISIIQ